MKLKVVELFAGVGGFRVGLNSIKEIDKDTELAIENSKWKFVWANQFEPSTKTQHAYECYVKRFGDKDVSNEDIAMVDKGNIPDHTLLVGGFPCQDYSVARSLNGEKGIEGKKGVLFWEIKDVLEKKDTPFVLLENVDRLLKSPSSRRGKDFAIMLKTFDELGYDVQWRVINAGDYSMPQKRRRVFIFAYKKTSKYANSISSDGEILDSNIFNREFKVEYKDREIKSLEEYEDTVDVNNSYHYGKFLETGVMKDGIIVNANIIPMKESPVYSLRKIISDARGIVTDLEKYSVEENKLEKWKYLKGGKKIERVSKDGHKYTYSEGSMSFPENINEPARTMLTSEGALNRSSHIIYDEDIEAYRILTEVECEMIQMFPPNWTDTMVSRKRYFVMGNALVTGIVNRIEPYLYDIIEKE